MAHQLLVAKLDGALSATHAAEANFATLSGRWGTRAPPLINEGVHHLEPALSCRGHHGSAKASSLCSFLQDCGKAQHLPWTIKRSPQTTMLAFCEFHTKYSKQATAFMFTQGQQQPMMGQYPQQPMGQPQQPMMGQQPQQPMVGQQQPMMGQQSMGQPNYQQPMQQQPSGPNYGGPSSQGNDRFGNNGGGYNNGNNGGGTSNGNNGGGNSGNSGNNNNSSSAGSSSKKGAGGALAAGILLPVIFAALGGVVAYMVFCRGGDRIQVTDGDSGDEPEPESDCSTEDDDDGTGSSR